MSRPILISLFVLLLTGLAPAQEGDDVVTQYQAAAAAGDEAALVKLWQENPYAILVTIDEDLEGSLSIRESESPDETAIAALHARALFGARCADQATGHPIFLEYASSYVGWTRDEEQRFRGGQAAHGKAQQALRAGDLDAAAKAGQECIDLAEPLGDWWGTAMGLGVKGQALLMKGDLLEALRCLQRARLINHDLGLVGSEYRNARAMVECLAGLNRTERLLATARQALALAGLVGDAKGQGELAALVKQLDERAADR